MSKLNKFLLSYLKSDWELSDYPLRVQNVGNLKPSDNKMGVNFPAKLRPLLGWFAEITGWEWMSAFGNSAEEAYANLACKFNTYKMGADRLPRPGKKVAGGPEDQHDLEAYEIIAVDFFGNILETNFYTCVLSDEASLWDFLPGEDYTPRITSRYGIDITDIRSGNLLKIFRRIYDRYQED